tara:strand:+ start:69 stop:446 length:378 start_codon:yes stop_codon:yes gene_type:complete
VLSFKTYTIVQEHSDTIKSFVSGCSNHLDLQDEPQINLVDEPEGGMTTGSFNPNTREIKVLAGPRALVDILRSIAHELVHQQQLQHGKLHDDSGKDGSPEENEAHSVAGLLMRKFEKENKHIYSQ